MTRARRRQRSGKEPRGSRAIRRGILLGCFLFSGSLILAKAAKLQVVEHERWAEAARDQHRERVELPARRGAIFDRRGVALALSHEMFQVSIAPAELRDRLAATQLLVESLGLPASEVASAVGSDRRWVVLPGRFSEEQRRRVGAMRGIYFARQFERLYPHGDAGREVIGAVTRDGRALGGIEQQLDELLRGDPGYTVLRRDASGVAQPALNLPVVPPTDGSSVHLTIDFDLQEIADAALREAIAVTGSSGGDLLIADPHSGEILAAVSRRQARSRNLTAITEPYEPGSTLKPFLTATLLAEGRARLSDTIYAEQGAWRDGGRTFRDTSPHAWLTLADALRVSSNIALVKFAKRLSPAQQYAYLRDFGFGTPTGVEYPSESAGRLRRPAEWSRLSSGSLAMGYELAVTPLQMLAAYGALANGGILMEPYLVREIRGPDGRVLARKTPTAIRRVVEPAVARAVTEVLVTVVEEGTGTRASLATFAVAGKTGTSRRTVTGSGYEAGSYISTFVGYFPAQDPQIVIFVKLDEPQGAYYGSLTAAPVTRETLQGILAARTGAIDGRTLLATRAEGPLAPSMSPRQPARLEPWQGGGTFVYRLADGIPSPAARGAATDLAMPRLVGMSMRDAVRDAHAAGLRVRVSGSGEVRRSEPAAGLRVGGGDTVVLHGAGP
jgi:cell division protein FtsI (penicillin-binding protein 3)